LKPIDFTAHHYVYTENRSKNHGGAFCQLCVENKVIPIFVQPECGDRCHVHLLDLYFSKLPSKALETDIFYLRPISLTTAPTDPLKPWFANVAYGENKLSSMVKDMCSGSNSGKRNHSLCARSTALHCLVEIV